MDGKIQILKRNQRSPLRVILRGSVWFGLAILLNRILPGILIIILAWWLEPRQLGIISFVLAYYSILLPVADWSISYVLQKLIPENRSQAKQIYWTAVLLRLGVSIFLGLVCWGLDVTIGVFHGYGLYLAVLLVVSVFGTVVYAHNALGNFAKGSLYSIGLYTLWIGIAVALVKAGMPISGPLLGLFLSFIVLGIYASLLDPAIRGNVVFLPKVAVEIIRFGLWATLAVVLSGFAGQIGVLIVDYVNGDAAAAVFKMAATFGIVPALLGMIVVLPLMPVAREGILNGHDIAVSLVLPITRYLLMLGLPITAAGLVLAPEVIATFTRHSYAGAIWPLRILLGANLLRAWMTAASGVLFVGEGLRALAKIYGAMVAITLVAGVFLARRWAVNGMAIAQLTSWIIGAILMCAFFRRRSSMRLEWKLYLRHAFSSLIMAAVVYFGTRVWHTAFERLILGGCISATVYLALLWLQRDSSLLSAAKVLRNWATG
ncbi:MAG: polysaccharide biosynthesis C-terminal domain-containing protein [Candidatus Acidiferrales bacterium]